MALPTMTPDEQAAFSEIQAAYAQLKSLMMDAKAQVDIIQAKCNTEMAFLKAKRIDTYNAVFGVKGAAVVLEGKIVELRGSIMRAHYEASALLQAHFADAATIVQNGPGR